MRRLRFSGMNSLICSVVHALNICASALSDSIKMDTTNPPYGVSNKYHLLALIIAIMNRYASL